MSIKQSAGPLCGHHDHNAGRRAFLKGATAASVGLLAGGLGFPDMSIGAEGGKTLVKVLMNGGADSLSLFPMVGDDYYYQVRNSISIARPSSSDAASAISLGNNVYAMNPNLADLMEIWETGRLAVSPATHFAEGNFSHFDCQRWIGLGTHADPSAPGLLNRVLRLGTGDNVFRGLNSGISASHFLEGSVIVPSVETPQNLRVASDVAANLLPVANRLEGSPVEQMTRGRMAAMFDAIDVVQDATVDYVASAGGLEYNDGLNGRPSTSLGRGLKLIAQLLKKGVPVEIACVAWSGHWDTHENQVSSSVIDATNGHAAALRAGARDLLTFWRDLASLRDRVVVVVGSEFGRNVKENGSRGTDHGRGGAWLAFGGPTQGGIHRPVTNLSSFGAFNVLPVNTSYKDMLGEALVRHMGMSETVVKGLFPGHTMRPVGIFTRSA